MECTCAYKQALNYLPASVLTHNRNCKMYVKNEDIKNAHQSEVSEDIPLE